MESIGERGSGAVRGVRPDLFVFASVAASFLHGVRIFCVAGSCTTEGQAGQGNILQEEKNIIFLGTLITLLGFFQSLPHLKYII